MRYLLLLLTILSISLCVQLPELFPQEVQQAGTGIVIVDTESPDLYIKVEAIPKEVRAGGGFSLIFELRNKNTYDLKNINLEIYDPCVFSGETLKKTIDILKADRSTTWSWRFSSSPEELEKECKIRFRTTYNARTYLSQDIAVLTLSEYQQRELAGTLQDIPIHSSSTNSPLLISLRFSDEQPFLEDQKYYFYLDYSNIGKGLIEVNKNDIKINIPTNIEITQHTDYITETLKTYEICKKSFFSACDNTTCSLDNTCWTNYTTCDITGEWNPGCDFNNDSKIDMLDLVKISTQEAKVLYLNKSLRFINNKAPTSTFTFNTKTSQPLDIKSLSLTANYKYVLDNSILVRVKR